MDLLNTWITRSNSSWAHGGAESYHVCQVIHLIMKLFPWSRLQVVVQHQQQVFLPYRSSEVHLSLKPTKWVSAYVRQQEKCAFKKTLPDCCNLCYVGVSILPTVCLQQAKSRRESGALKAPQHRQKSSCKEKQNFYSRRGSKLTVFNQVY